MIINKLVGLERTLELVKMGYPFGTFTERQTGRSTALAFKIIGAAMQDPGYWNKIDDHFNSFKADRYLLDTIRDIIDKLDYKCFVMRVTPPSIKFDLFEEYEETITWRLKEKLKTFKHMITEAAYPSNVGFQEMAKFYQTADKKQIKQMEKIIKAEDWEGFKKIIQNVLDIKLK